jgi:Bacterial protein of unknown function (Gcw_chp)
LVEAEGATGKLFNFFTPSISGTVGFQSYEDIASDYTYWNAGLTLGFLEHWSADIRYYETDYNADECFVNSGGRNNCDARAVGTIKATFFSSYSELPQSNFHLTVRGALFFLAVPCQTLLTWL